MMAQILLDLDVKDVKEIGTLLNEIVTSDARIIKGEVKADNNAKHELTGFSACTFGDGGFYYHDGADRAICSCGWKSAAAQRDKTALVALWKIHKESAPDSPKP